MIKDYLTEKQLHGSSGECVTRLPYEKAEMRVTALKVDGFLCVSTIDYNATIVGHEIGVEEDMTGNPYTDWEGGSN